MKYLHILWIIILVISIPTLVRSQSFCLTDFPINKQSPDPHKVQEQPCKLYWINIYIHRVEGNGWNGYNSTIDIDIIENLNSSFNQYGFYFEVIGSRNWFTSIYSAPDALDLILNGIFDDPQSLQHTDAIDIYLLPSNSPIEGGFIPSYNKKVMAIGGERTVIHCSGDTTTYKVATTNVISHEIGHCLGLPHTFDVSIGTSEDDVEENACVDPSSCQFVNDCTECNVTSNPTINMNNFMSYTIPNCMSVLSKKQVSLMRESLDSSMASVVDRTQGLPSAITGNLDGPFEVTKGFVVQFSVSDEIERNESLFWSIPKGFLQMEEENNNRSIRTWIGSTAESGNVQVWKTNFCGNSHEISKNVIVTSDDCVVCPAVKIFPNPAHEKIFISYSSQESGDQVFFEKPREYLIVNTQGKTVHKYESRLTNPILDITHINQGAYILIITYEELRKHQLKFFIVK